MEKKHNDPHDDSYYDELIKQRIGEALRNQSRKERLDLAQLEAWVEEDRQRRRAKVKRILAIASCFVILCIGTFSLKFVFNPDDSIATAGKNDNKVNEEGNSVVVKPNEEDAEENMGIREMKCTSWADVKSIEQQFPRMMKPHYVPEGYEFFELSVEYTDLMETYTYKYMNGKMKLEIKQIAGATTTVFNQYNRRINCTQGDLLIMEDEGITAGCKIEEGVLYVIVKNCSDDELVKIVDGIK